MVEVTKFPILPFSQLRDDRPRSLLTKPRKLKIIKHATRIRRIHLNENDKLDVENFLHLKMREILGMNYDWAAADAPFEGMSSKVLAYCDFDIGDPQIFIRPDVFAELCDPNCKNHKFARFVVSHEIAHALIPDHAKGLTKLKTQEKLGAVSAAFGSTYGQNIDIRILRMEEEADIFALCLLVDVPSISVQSSIPEISETYGLDEQHAYFVAILCKDFHRINFLNDRRRKG